MPFCTRQTERGTHAEVAGGEGRLDWRTRLHGEGEGVNIDVAMAGRGTPDMGCVVELVVVGREGRGHLPAQEGG